MIKFENYLLQLNLNSIHIRRTKCLIKIANVMIESDNYNLFFQKYLYFKMKNAARFDLGSTFSCIGINSGGGQVEVG